MPTAKKKAAKTNVKKKTTVKKVSTTKARKTTVKKQANKAPASTAAEGFHLKDISPYQEKANEKYMNENQIEHFRNLLNTWKKELMEEVDRTLHYMQDEATNFPDPNDRASQESDFTMELRTRDRERKLIKKINESAELLKTGDYGYCESCGIEIGISRLEARPTATYCIDCKTLDEIKEKQRK